MNTHSISTFIAAGAIIATGFSASAQTLVLSDSFDTGGVATNDLNFNQDARQAGTAKPIGFNRTTHTGTDAIYNLTADGRLKIKGGGDAGWHPHDYVVTDDFGADVGGDSFSIKWKSQFMAGPGPEGRRACLINIECDAITDEPFMYDLSPISVVLWNDHTIEMQYGTTENNRYNGNNLAVSLSPEIVDDAIGGTYNSLDEHEFEIRATAQSATSGTWSLYLDGNLLVSALPYVFDDAVKKINWQPHPEIDCNFNDLEISTIISPVDESEYVFFDDFNADDYPNANWGYTTRQTNGIAIGPYGAAPQFFSITNNKLHNYWNAAELKQGGDLSSHIVGKDFELSCKLTVLTSDTEWTSIYLYDDTGNPRGDSRLGCLAYGQAHSVAFSLYAGTGPGPEGQVPGGDVTVAQLTAALGTPYDKTVEHTLQFVSTAGTDETNTYDFVVDGVTMVSNIVYRFDGAFRSVGIIGIMPIDATKGSFYDDLYVRAFPELTYETWAEDNGLIGDDALRTADIENGGVGDGVENLLEYVLGGDPNVDDAASILPVLQFPDATTMEYIYRRRNDAAARGLTYDFQTKGNLVTDLWASRGDSETGTNAVSAEIDEITNSVDITEDSEMFLNLEVAED